MSPGLEPYHNDSNMKSLHFAHIFTALLQQSCKRTDLILEITSSKSPKTRRGGDSESRVTFELGQGGNFQSLVSGLVCPTIVSKIKSVLY